ncbi:MAG: trypsin-like peptidase domain-containing protein [Planctomycetota bacterium]
MPFGASEVEGQQPSRIQINPLLPGAERFPGAERSQIAPSKPFFGSPRGSVGQALSPGQPGVPPGQPGVMGARQFVPSGSAGSARAGALSDGLGQVRQASATSGAPRIPSGTLATVPTQLTSLLESGGVPTSLADLGLLQRQVRLITSSAAACTVAVQIGPAQGCGVIITGTGYVLTAAHVAMRPGKSARLTLPDGRIITATTLGMNRSVDAGLMRISPGQNGGQPWPHASLGSSDQLQAGMWCIATGHPGGYDEGRGVVTRVGRILAVGDDAIVTDCALIGGDSGGPLFDLSGRLIAIHSRIGNDVADNLHVPINHYDTSWEEMASGKAYGYLPGFKPVLGVRGNNESPTAEILSVSQGSPAGLAGIEVGDVIEVFGDHRITDFQSLKDAVGDTMPGERVKVWLRRQGRSLPFMVEIGRMDE